MAQNVTYSVTNYKGQPALKLQLTTSYQQYFLDFDVNKTEQDNGYLQLDPKFVMNDGFIGVDIAAVRNNYSYNVPFFFNLTVGAFTGLKFRIQKNGQQDSVEIRTANGALNNPAPVAALAGFCAQYSAPPNITFNTLLGNSTYSAAAQVAEGQWFRLNILVRDNKLTAFTGNFQNGAIIFNQVPLLGADKPGAIALWVRTGTDAYFANFQYAQFGGRPCPFSGPSRPFAGPPRPFHH